MCIGVHRLRKVVCGRGLLRLISHTTICKGHWRLPKKTSQILCHTKFKHSAMKCSLRVPKVHLVFPWRGLTTYLSLARTDGKTWAAGRYSALPCRLSLVFCSLKLFFLRNVSSMLQDKLLWINGVTNNPDFLYFSAHREKVNSEVVCKNADKAVGTIDRSLLKKDLTC